MKLSIKMVLNFLLYMIYFIGHSLLPYFYQWNVKESLFIWHIFELFVTGKRWIKATLPNKAFLHILSVKHDSFAKNLYNRLF